MPSDAPTAVADRVFERRRAVALARHFREAEGLSIAQIAERLGRSPVTIKAYFYDGRDRYGRLPSSYDWSRTHARRRGGEALVRLAGGEWPSASVVTPLFGTWAAACAAAVRQEADARARQT